MVFSYHLCWGSNQTVPNKETVWLGDPNRVGGKRHILGHGPMSQAMQAALWYTMNINIIVDWERLWKYHTSHHENVNMYQMIIYQ